MLSVDAAYQTLGGEGGVSEGVTYGLMEKNSIEALFMTLNLWGHHPAIARRFLDRCL